MSLVISEARSVIGNSGHIHLAAVGGEFALVESCRIDGARKFWIIRNVGTDLDSATAAYEAWAGR